MEKANPVPLDDVIQPGSDCNCEFSPYSGEDEREESWHYFRRCLICGAVWYSLHCPHEGHQNKCLNGHRAWQADCPKPTRANVPAELAKETP